MSKAGDLITRIYGGFRGVDFRGEEVNIVRSPDSLNMWKDYRETESIRTRPKMSLQKAFDEPVWGVYFFKGQMLVHSGNALYRMGDGEREVLYDELLAQRSNAFVYEDVWYFKDGKHYLRYDGEAIEAVEGYIPTTTIARKPSGGGTPYEDVNMISNKRRNSFLADGESKDYYLDTMSIDNDYVPVVTVNNNLVSKSTYTVDYVKGIIKFDTAPSKPLTDGQDNVLIEFKKTVESLENDILGCTLLQVFDNRVFFSGNKDKPNMIWHCSLDDPTYCSDTDYYKEGLDLAAVRGMVAGNNALWVFREPSSANTTVFYHTPTIDEEYGKIYPSVHSSITTGCIGGAINFGDDIVFFSDRGMEGISGDVTTEQVLGHRSTLVDRKLLSADGYKDMVLVEWEGYLLVFIGDKCFAADSRGTFQNGNHIEYEWFYWEMGAEVTSAVVDGGVLFIGTENAVYALNDNEGAVESWWVTPKDKFNNPQKLKTSNKRGCVAEATGDISVYAKLEDTGFEHIGTYENITDYFVSRIKRKKWKDIQLKLYSSKRFSLEQITLECFIGGYIKR